MADQETSDRTASGWLAAGVALGIVVAAAVVWLGVSVVGSDEPPTAAGPPQFFDDAPAAGVDHVYDGEFTFFVGGGVAVLDCDADGFPDLYFAGGESAASLYRNESSVGEDLLFSEVPNAATDLTKVVGAYPVDIDADRHVDLAVLRYGENVLLRGLGDCRFERANERWDFDGGSSWTAGFSAAWESADAFPTLALGNYLALDEEGEHTWDCADNELHRPQGGSYGDSTALAPGWCTLSTLFTDWNRTGSPDLRVANDRHYYRDGQEQLWRIEAGLPPSLYTSDDGWKSLQIWGMGIASHDLTGDGRPEMFVTSQGDNKLQTLGEEATGPEFVDIAIRRGVTAHRPYAGDTTMPSTAWHPEFRDVNNDGFIDLYISKGNVEAQIDHAGRDPNNLFIGQPDGTFVEGAPAAGIDGFSRTRGAALVDLNLDGRLDLVEVNRREPVKLWRNLGSADDSGSDGKWIALRLAQSGANIDAIGSWIEVRIGDRITEHELTIGGGHAGDQLGWVHFGIGRSDKVDVRVHWPDGSVGPWVGIDANRFAIIDRDTGEPRYWTPGSGEEPR